METQREKNCLSFHSLVSREELNFWERECMAEMERSVHVRVCHTSKELGILFSKFCCRHIWWTFWIVGFPCFFLSPEFLIFLLDCNICISLLGLTIVRFIISWDYLPPWVAWAQPFWMRDLAMGRCFLFRDEVESLAKIWNFLTFGQVRNILQIKFQGSHLPPLGSQNSKMYLPVSRGNIIRRISDNFCFFPKNEVLEADITPSS